MLIFLISLLMGILGSLAYRQIKEQEKRCYCTPIERAFLDELKDKGVWWEETKEIVIGARDYTQKSSSLNQYYFKTSLKGLVNEI